MANQMKKIKDWKRILIDTTALCSLFRSEKSAQLKHLLNNPSLHKIASAGIELTGNLLLIKKLK